MLLSQKLGKVYLSTPYSYIFTSGKLNQQEQIFKILINIKDALKSLLYSETV